MSSRTDLQRRWVSVEWLGILSGAGFFVGLYFAYRTFTGGLITEAEFRSLSQGMTLAQVNTELGFEGTLVPTSQPAAHPKTMTYRWENSTRSWVEADFLHGRLTRSDSHDLP